MQQILIVTDAWHPQVNGVVRVIEGLHAELAERGIETLMLEPSRFWAIPMPFYPEIRLALFPKRRVGRFIRSQQFDAIHIATEGPLGRAARRVCKSRRISFTTSYHTHFSLYLQQRGIGRFIVPLADAYLRWFHRAAVTTMVATESLRSDLESRGFTHLSVWPLGVDTDLFKRNPNPPTIPGLRPPVFAYCGRLAVEKNVDEFLRLELPGTKIVIGDGPERARLECAFPDTRFVGYQVGPNLVDWFSRTDVLVSPSRTETFGLVALEALSCGVPVAAHDVMGPRDIITSGVDGWLGEDLRGAAQKAFGLSKDACRKKAREYSWSRSTDVFLEHLAIESAKTC